MYVPMTALAATPYLETTLILFLHILAAMATLGGALGVLVLYLRARNATDAAEAVAVARAAQAFARSVLIPAAALVGIIGLMLAVRYHQRGIFSFGKQTWLHLAIVLWVIQQGMVGALPARIHDGIDRSGATTGGASRVTFAPAVSALAWGTLVVTVLIVYLMVFQPFVRD